MTADIHAIAADAFARCDLNVDSDWDALYDAALLIMRQHVTLSDADADYLANTCGDNDDLLIYTGVAIELKMTPREYDAAYAASI